MWQWKGLHLTLKVEAPDGSQNVIAYASLRRAMDLLDEMFGINKPR